jgi:hypothetical protein
MKKITGREKSEMKMESAIWNHGRRKATFTVAINKLRETGLSDHPDVKKVILLLHQERQKLKNTNPLD